MDKRDIGQEILESIRAIKRGEGKCYTMELPEPKATRERMNYEFRAIGLCSIIWCERL